ncbi:putative Receptor-like protein kinase [Quillaja saponaria]|uniref:Receptor-like protein kinase n=1 Tax=Quillaja saponaria TaxID=32244 RepID=A0AAD7KSN6_QUISA|nr:putative Receptor-like protein kinase [Quillaja saponaria]
MGSTPIFRLWQPFCKIHVLPLLFLLQFSSLHFLSLAYDIPDKYFINCGSDASVNESGRNFIGDTNSKTLYFAKSGTEKESSTSSQTSQLYQTARIFRHPSSYEFDIDGFGSHLVRLHFFAFSSTSNLPTALFNVSASGFLLLHNFSAESSSKSPLQKEFFLNIRSSKFQIDFIPVGSSFAFVNAIEVFRIPVVNFTQDEVTHRSDYKGLLSKVLQSTYTINVGGLAIKPEKETLWRNWDTDDSFLYNKGTAKNSAVYSSKLNFRDEKIYYFAPDQVYQTAKEMNADSDNQSNLFNITWGFGVKKNAVHLVRVHFCDTFSTFAGDIFFNLYISSNFSQIINSYNYSNNQAYPFYLDFPVASDSSELVNISIGIHRDSPKKTAFLNGLEILEVIDTSGLVPIPINKTTDHLPLVLGSVLGGLALICILLVGFMLGRKFRKPTPVENSEWSPMPVNGGGSSQSRETELTIHSSPFPNLNLGLKISFSDLQFATNNFDEKRLIGKGGFGNVYRGILRNGTKVAVKRSEPGSGQGLPEFQTEIMVLSKIRHRHLVSLIGYCDENYEMILVYEFMEKGTLRDHLYNSNFPSLSWKQRLEICIDAARGLDYLHKGSAGGIIHRDVKSTNILLDENHIAKVADFGLSRTGTLDQTYVSTGVKGTFGYLDPEYFRSEQLTEKSDVYSFGVVLLEVLCARPAIDPILPREQANLAEWGILCKKKGKLEEIIDPSIRVQIDPNSLRKFSVIAEKCLQEDGSERPNMGDVLWDLEYALQLQRGARLREPHEDSTTDASAPLALPNVRRLPSLNSFTEVDDTAILGDDESNITVNDVFSQLRTDDAR